MPRIKPQRGHFSVGGGSGDRYPAVLQSSTTATPYFMLQTGSIRAIFGEYILKNVIKWFENGDFDPLVVYTFKFSSYICTRLGYRCNAEERQRNVRQRLDRVLERLGGSPPSSDNPFKYNIICKQNLTSM